jgi:hypothetical protein
MPGKRGTSVERFWPKVDTDGPIPSSRPDLGPCWLWCAEINHRNGYGRYRISTSRSQLAHRFAYELLVGPIPDGLDLDHLCRVRACVNPAHLEPVTRRENLLRGNTIPARFAERTHCNDGHPLSGENLRITSSGHRACATCQRRWRKEQTAREHARV